MYAIQPSTAQQKQPPLLPRRRDRRPAPPFPDPFGRTRIERARRRPQRVRPLVGGRLDSLCLLRWAKKSDIVVPS
ncbi:hypothetical protein BT69DRAFT_1275332 [Atractiella rhizophila]|nr:hypothetical protein BT69DRAFT_1275332 [Atractiella rhizophila]